MMNLQVEVWRLTATASLYDRLSEVLPDRPLLPMVDTITLQRRPDTDWSFCRFFHIVFGPQLRILELTEPMFRPHKATLHSMRDMADRTPEERSVATMLVNFSRRASGLQEFTLSFGPSSHLTVCSLSNMLCNLRELISVRIFPNNFPLASGTITHLAVLPGSQSLQFTADTTAGIAEDADLRVRSKGESLFPSLSFLEVTIHPFALLSKFLRCISFPNLIFLLISFPGAVPRANIDPLIGAIAAMPCKTRLDCIGIIVADVFEGAAGVDDGLLERMAVALPQLVRIELGVDSPWATPPRRIEQYEFQLNHILNPLGPWANPRATLRGLLAFSRACPSIEMLGTEVYAVLPPASAPQVRLAPRRAVRTLLIGLSPIENPERVAAFLGVSFPHIRLVEDEEGEGDHHGPERAKWWAPHRHRRRTEAVQDLMPYFAALRG
ncbi:hypothetical protein BD413DRAFT_625957 [Trametes elegans]|nr:hypothetical protein BD413DRAFT_625957 [Trametes elegans]